MIIPFTKLAGISTDQLDAAIDSFTEADWDRFEKGYLDGAVIEFGDWWISMLGLADDVDVALLFCNLYHRSLARTSGV